MMLERLTLLLWLAVLLPAAATAKPVKRRVVRRPAAVAPVPAPEDAAGAPSAPDPGPASTDPRDSPDAPPPEAAPPKPPAPADEAPPAPSGASPDLQKLRADYDRLRDELFRTRARAQLVQEGLYASRLAARLEWKAAPDFVIRRAEVRLDGGTIWESGDKPVTDDLIKIAERPCKPGPHALTLRLEIRPGTKKKGKDVEQLGYASEHTFAIVVPDGKRTTVTITGDEDGALPDYGPALEVELDSEAVNK
jgi:hypothetical protein